MTSARKDNWTSYRDSQTEAGVPDVADGRAGRDPTSHQHVTTLNRQRTSPLVGLLVASAIIITITTLPCLVLRRRLTRSEEALSRAINAASMSQRDRAANIAREQSRMSKQLELLLRQTDRAAGDIKDIRNIMLKERGCVTALESHLGAISEQLNSQEQKVLASLATGQGRAGRTETDMNELRKVADQNACKLNKVGDSLADIAAFIDMTEIEQGVLPERGQESSRRVNALRMSALKLQDGNTSRK